MVKLHSPYSSININEHEKPKKRDSVLYIRKSSSSFRYVVLHIRAAIVWENVLLPSRRAYQTYKAMKKGPFCYFSIFNVLLFVVVAWNVGKWILFVWHANYVICCVKENFLISFLPHFRPNNDDNVLWMLNRNTMISFLVSQQGTCWSVECNIFLIGHKDKGFFFMLKFKA